MALSFVLMVIITFLSFSFAVALSPVTMGSILLFQVSFVAVATSILFKTTWYSYILFLIFVGAVLVWFAYMIALSPNNQFMTKGNIVFLIILSFVSGLTCFFMDPLIFNIPVMVENFFSQTNFFYMTSLMSISWIYNMSAAKMTLFVILYLLLTLIVVVKISNIKSGPLRMS